MKIFTQMLVIMLIVYYLCWGSWLASKLVGWWLQDTGLTFTQAFYRFSFVLIFIYLLLMHLPFTDSVLWQNIYPRFMLPSILSFIGKFLVAKVSVESLSKIKQGHLLFLMTTSNYTSKIRVKQREQVIQLEVVIKNIVPNK